MAAEPVNPLFPIIMLLIFVVLMFYLLKTFIKGMKDVARSMKDQKAAPSAQPDDLFVSESSSAIHVFSERRFDCPYEELDLTDADHIMWLKSTPDSELWHVAVQASLAYTDDPHRFVPWVVAQPGLDRGTAGWIFFWMEGSRFLTGETAFNHSFSDDAYILDVFSRLTERSEDTGFDHDNIGLDAGLEPERKKCFEIITANQVSSGRTAPHAIIDHAYSAEKEIKGIDIVEGTICF